ncbi:MAG: AAA family ATPase, partial [Romboutsia sp.]|nr:AAA family ATPase [Romboutsia sp.]
MPLFGQKGFGSIVNGVFLKLLLLSLYLPFVLILLTLETLLYFGSLIGFIYFLLQFNLLGIIGIILGVVLLLYYLYDFTNFLQINHKHYSFENIYLSGHSGLRNVLDLGKYNLYNLYQYLSKNEEANNFLKLLEIDPSDFHSYVFEGIMNLSKQEYEQNLLDLIKKYGVKNLNESILFFAFLQVVNIDGFIASREQISKDDFEKAFIILNSSNIERLDFSISVLNRISQELNQAVTPTLYKYTENLSRLKDKKKFFHNVSRNELVNNITAMIKAKSSNILLSGKFGTGRSTLIKGLVYDFQQDFFQLNVDKLVEDKDSASILQRIISEVGIVGGILYIENVHRLVSDNLTGSQEILLNILASNLKSKKLRLIMSTDPINLEKYLRSNPAILHDISLIDFHEPIDDDLERILINHYANKIIDHGNSVKISYLAIKEAIAISNQYNYTDNQPTKAINLITNALATGTFVSINDIKMVASQLYRMPINTLSDEERDKYLNLEDE